MTRSIWNRISEPEETIESVLSTQRRTSGFTGSKQPGCLTFHGSTPAAEIMPLHPSWHWRAKTGFPWALCLSQLFDFVETVSTVGEGSLTTQFKTCTLAARAPHAVRTDPERYLSQFGKQLAIHTYPIGKNDQNRGGGCAPPTSIVPESNNYLREPKSF